MAVAQVAQVQDVRALAQAALLARREREAGEAERTRLQKELRYREGFRRMLVLWGVLPPDAATPAALMIRSGDAILRFFESEYSDYLQVGVEQRDGSVRWSRQYCAQLADAGLALEEIAAGTYDTEPVEWRRGA